MSGGVEEQSVELSAVKAGIKLETGHAVVLLVNGLHGTKPAGPGAAGAAEGEAAAKGGSGAAAAEGDAAAGGTAGTAAGSAEAGAPGEAGAKDPAKQDAKAGDASDDGAGTPDATPAAAGEAPAQDELGHISLRLLDESGTVPLADKDVTLDLGGAGKVNKKTDADGKVSHPDVPLQDYALSIGEAKVMVPAIPRDEAVHEQAVPGVRFGFLRLAIRDAAGDPLPKTEISVEGPAQARGATDDDGNFSQPGPLPPGKFTVRAGGASASVELPNSPWRTAVVHLQ